MHNTLWFVKYTDTYQGVRCIDKITPIIYCYILYAYICMYKTNRILMFSFKRTASREERKGRM